MAVITTIITESLELKNQDFWISEIVVYHSFICIAVYARPCLMHAEWFKLWKTWNERTNKHFTEDLKFSHAASENKRAMHQHMVHAVCLVRARIGAEISSSCDFCMVRKLNEKKTAK